MDIAELKHEPVIELAEEEKHDLIEKEIREQESSAETDAKNQDNGSAQRKHDSAEKDIKEQQSPTEPEIKDEANGLTKKKPNSTEKDTRKQENQAKQDTKDQEYGPVEAPEMEIVYGPTPRDELKSSFTQTFNDYFDWLGCWIITLMLLLGPPFMLVICVVPVLWIFGMLYLFWMYYDSETPHKGGRRLKFLRKLRFWRYRRDYFPIRLVKTAELPPDTTYMFASFPHGILVFGASTNFVSDVNHFDKAYPGLDPYIMTLNANFNFPIAREMLLYFGVCAASKKSISHVLNGPPGNVCILIVGGVAEALKSIPGTYNLVLKNRKGFVKMALKSGSSLVPVFSFGETDCYDQLSGKWYRWIQGKLRATVGVPFVIIRGRGILSHSIRLLPYQRPITTVVGRPIKLPKCGDQEPPTELVDKYHKIFIDEITTLFEKYKGKYDLRGEKATLVIE